MQNRHQLRKRAYALVFEVGGGWKWRRTITNIENEHTRSFSRLVVGGGGWWWRRTTTNSENERVCLFSRLVVGGGAGWWWWSLVGGGGVKRKAVMSNGRPWCQRRVVVGKKPLRLAFEQGRGSGGVKQVVVVSIEGGGVNRGWWCQWRVVAIIISMRQEACRVEMPIKMNK